jgi:hypothetical protein
MRPLSNSVLNVFPDLASHNIRRLHEAACASTELRQSALFSRLTDANFAAVQEKLGRSASAVWERAGNSFTGLPAG